MNLRHSERHRNIVRSLGLMTCAATVATAAVTLLVTSAGATTGRSVDALHQRGSSTSPIDGAWDGTYTCGGSARGLHLQIKGPASALTANFVFYPISPSILPGEYSMTGTYASATSITLNPNAWIIQPGTYSMVGLNGSLSGDTFSGTAQGCGTFSVTKTTTTPSRAKLIGTWKGSYLGCEQGPTALKLLVRKDGPSGDELSATFKFSALKTNPGVPNGSFKVTGFVFPNWAVLIGTTWIHHPGSYQIVSLVGAPPAAKKWTGMVPSCSTFSLKRTSTTP
jgi:hypothetical protein